MSVIDLFQKDLVNKLNFKASSKVSSESLLLKTFKFFDLNNAGILSRNQFFRAISKIGVIISSPDDMDEIFNYYDKTGSGKIDYQQFTDRVLVKPAVDDDEIMSTPKQKSVQKLSESKFVRDQEDNQNSPISQVKGIQYKKPTNKTLSTPQDVVDFIRERLKEQGIDQLLDKALKLKLLDTSRTHRISISKVGQVFPYVTREQLGSLLPLLNSSQNGEINYGEFIYFLRGKLAPPKASLVSNCFARLDVRKQGEILLQEVLGKNFDRLRAKQFEKAVQDYCRFQGIDDGVFTEEDFMDFFAFVSLPFSDEDFVLYMESAYPQQDRKSSKSQRSKREFQISRKGDQIEQRPKGNFAKDKTQIKNTTSNKKSDNASSSIGRSGMKNKQQKQSRISKTSRLSNISKDIEMILSRISKRLSSKGPKGFLSFQKALLAADLDQDSLLNLQQLKKVVRDQRVDISETQCQLIFEIFDPQHTGFINYVELLQNIKVQIPEYRQKLIARVWDRVKDTDELTSFTKVRNSYQVRSHPDIKNAKRYEEELLRELIQTLMLVQQLNGYSSEEITKADFRQYLENFSYSTPDDRLFETTLVAVWKLGSQTRIEDKYAGTRKHFETGKNSYLQDHHRYLIQGGTVAQNAPFGTYNEPTNYSTQSRRYDQQN